MSARQFYHQLTSQVYHRLHAAYLVVVLNFIHAHPDSYEQIAVLIQDVFSSLRLFTHEGFFPFELRENYQQLQAFLEQSHHQQSGVEFRTAQIALAVELLPPLSSIATAHTTSMVPHHMLSLVHNILLFFLGVVGDGRDAFRQHIDAFIAAYEQSEGVSLSAMLHEHASKITRIPSVSADDHNDDTGDDTGDNSFPFIPLPRVDVTEMLQMSPPPPAQQDTNVDMRTANTTDNDHTPLASLLTTPIPLAVNASLFHAVRVHVLSMAASMVAGTPGVDQAGDEGEDEAKDEQQHSHVQPLLQLVHNAREFLLQQQPQQTTLPLHKVSHRLLDEFYPAFSMELLPMCTGLVTHPAFIPTLADTLRGMCMRLGVWWHPDDDSEEKSHPPQPLSSSPSTTLMPPQFHPPDVQDNWCAALLQQWCDLCSAAGVHTDHDTASIPAMEHFLLTPTSNTMLRQPLESFLSWTDNGIDGSTGTPTQPQPSRCLLAAMYNDSMWCNVFSQPEEFPHLASIYGMARRSSGVSDASDNCMQQTPSQHTPAPPSLPPLSTNVAYLLTAFGHTLSQQVLHAAVPLEASIALRSTAELYRCEFLAIQEVFQAKVQPTEEFLHALASDPGSTTPSSLHTMPSLEVAGLVASRLALARFLHKQGRLVVVLVPRGDDHGDDNARHSTMPMENDTTETPPVIGLSPMEFHACMSGTAARGVAVVVSSSSSSSSPSSAPPPPPQDDIPSYNQLVHLVENPSYMADHPLTAVLVHYCRYASTFILQLQTLVELGSRAFSGSTQQQTTQQQHQQGPSSHSAALPTRAQKRFAATLRNTVEDMSLFLDATDNLAQLVLDMTNVTATAWHIHVQHEQLHGTTHQQDADIDDAPNDDVNFDTLLSQLPSPSTLSSHALLLHLYHLVHYALAVLCGVHRRYPVL